MMNAFRELTPVVPKPVCHFELAVIRLTHHSPAPSNLLAFRLM
jgi:hypothetical protein